MSKIDIDKLLCSLIQLSEGSIAMDGNDGNIDKYMLRTALAAQGWECIDGELRRVDHHSIKIPQGKLVINEQAIDINGMVEEYKSECYQFMLPLGVSKKYADHVVSAYRKGLEDMLDKIKGGK